MNEEQVVAALTALAHPQRLRLYRALVAAGRSGLVPSTIADGLGIARNTLSFHLKELQRADLVRAEPRGRNLIYRAVDERIDGLVDYLHEHVRHHAREVPSEA